MATTPFTNRRDGQYVTCHYCRNNDICKFREEFTAFEQSLNRDIFEVKCKRFEEMKVTDVFKPLDGVGVSAEPGITSQPTQQRKGTTYGADTLSSMSVL